MFICLPLLVSFAPPPLQTTPPGVVNADDARLHLYVPIVVVVTPTTTAGILEVSCFLIVFLFFLLFILYLPMRMRRGRRERQDTGDRKQQPRNRTMIFNCFFVFFNIHFVLTNEDEKRERRETGRGRRKTTTVQQD